MVIRYLFYTVWNILDPKNRECFIVVELEPIQFLTNWVAKIDWNILYLRVENVFVQPNKNLLKYLNNRIT